LPVLKKLEKFDLVYIEQPLPTWDIAGMAQLAQALDTPIMADESAVSPEGVMTLVRFGAVDIVNIKIMKSGLLRSRAIAAVAEAAGLSCMIGSMVELGIGTVAGIHFACATRSVTHRCELVGPLMLESYSLVGEPYSTAPADFAWHLPDGPGWGVTLKEEYR
jgi:L-alanine-DL-glutamate epimerase-like enolase superfamily enzyme